MRDRYKIGNGMRQKYVYCVTCEDWYFVEVSGEISELKDFCVIIDGYITRVGMYSKSNERAE